MTSADDYSNIRHTMPMKRGLSTNAIDKFSSVDLDKSYNDTVNAADQSNK